ncbi:uncharacterized protein LOC126698472 isoform X2 [Quercus robur]|uniref:uncharacterized protein LOC126698472 isoform X2 n=1 Tax=Quercus robur TaxID=38942 RepID=UPI00216134A5|nr:uncharacterized protein LOC126698472 isoform X2 [Quercus robur]
MAEEIETMSSSLSEDTLSQSQAPAPAPALSSFPAFSNEYKVHAYNRNGICSLGFMDDHYPVRSAFSLLNQLSERQNQAFGGGPHSIRYVILSLSFMEFDSFFVVAVDSNSPIQKPFFFWLLLLVWRY